jgi:tetratricopeptide (TPR) repeat protein
MKIRYFILFITFLGVFCICSCTAPRTAYVVTPVDKERLLKARDHFTAGLFYQLENNHEQALIEFYQVLLYDSLSTEIYNRIAENHMALGRYESALRYLQKSQGQNPGEIETTRLIAECYYRLQNDDKAILYLNQVLSLDPLDENSRALLLLLYRKTNNQIGMARQYEKMIELYGEDEDWVRRAAAIYLESGQIDEALMLFQSYLNTDSTNAGMWYSVGTAYELKDQPDDAVGAYEKSLKYLPKFEPPAREIYKICRKKNQWDKILNVFQSLHQFEPTIIFYRMILAEAYLNKNQYQQTRELLLPVSEQQGLAWQVYELLGRADLAEKKYLTAGNYFQTIIDKDVHNPMGWLLKGFVLSDMDSLLQAEQHYRHSLEYLPDNSYLLSFHGISLSRLGRDEEALVPLHKAIDKDSTNINAWLSYGFALNRLNRNSAAALALEKVLELDPANLTALTTLGMIYDTMKLFPKSDSIYEQALQLYPENDLLLNNYAYSLAERNEKLEYALELALKAIAAKPDNGAYLDTVGWVYYKLAKFQQAFSYIQQSLAIRENSAVVIEHLGDVYLKLNQISAAVKCWRRSLELTTDQETLKHKLEIYGHEK